jgi:ubiquitin-activating enzyme E1
VFKSIDEAIKVNEFCRSKGVGFILSQNYGPAGFAFLDYGNDFSITDADGEDTKSFIVVSATQTNPLIITVHEDKRHKFQDGDYVKFTEVQGMTELNTLEPT